jgi:hypothetical protein
MQNVHGIYSTGSTFEPGRSEKHDVPDSCGEAICFAVWYISHIYLPLFLDALHIAAADQFA